MKLVYVTILMSFLIANSLSTKQDAALQHQPCKLKINISTKCCSDSK